jgi:hypothetical protein
MLAEAPDCGVSSHIRIVPVGESRGEATFRSRTRTRPTLVVEEDYELLPEEYGPRVEFDSATFQPEDVWVATSVQSAFTSYHGVGADEAIANIRLLLKLASQNRKHAQLESGAHVFWWRGYTAILSPDLGAVVRYRTTHYERTPRMVANGVKSRLRKASTGARQRESRPVPDDLRVGAVLDGPIVSVVSYGAFVDIGGFDGLLHRSEMVSAGEDPRAVFAVGEVLRVEVVSIDRERRRIGLRMLDNGLNRCADRPDPVSEPTWREPPT